VHDKQVRRRRAVLGLLVAVSLILLTAYFGESASSPLHSVQRGFVEVLSPVQDGASKALKPVRDIAGWFSDTFHAKSQADQLRTEVHHLQAEVAQYQTAWEQNQHFAALLKLDNKIGAAGFSPVTSQVISKDPTLWYETIEVNKGSDDGVALNDPVVGDNGLVGKISLVSATASWVTLITDHTMAVAAIVDDPAGVGQAVRVVHPQPADQPVRHPAQDQGVGGPENLRVLDPHRGQRGDVEEPPVVQLGVGPAPVDQPVVLTLVHLLRGAVAGAGRDREPLVVVGQLAVDQLEVGHGIIIGQHRDHDRRPAPVDVEELRVLRLGPVLQRVPPGRIGLGQRDALVVGHDVDHQPEAGLAQPLGQPGEALVAAQRRAGFRRVDDVVSVRGTRRGGQHR